MKNTFNIIAIPLVMFAFTQLSLGELSKKHTSNEIPLNARIDHFDITDGVMRDALSELSTKLINHIHLGFEEITRNKIQDDPRASGPHFSLHVKDRTVAELLDKFCKLDSRYIWSADGITINIYPRDANDKSYLMNLWIRKIDIKDVPDPNQALTPLAKLFPQQQIGYIGIGVANNTYPAPWTARFEQLTVRQFINRITEHIGPETSWIWQGGQHERLFTFLEGGFHTSAVSERR